MHVYDILKRPVVTEKSNAQADNLRQYTFEVDQRANKIQVKDAVETAFNVKVVGVSVDLGRGRSGR
jgi:large subunit ribosomal protein L23